jgi:hypothetical protein
MRKKNEFIAKNFIIKQFICISYIIIQLKLGFLQFLKDIFKLIKRFIYFE